MPSRYDRSRRQRRPARRSQLYEPKRRVLAVCEGNTERDYLQLFARSMSPDPRSAAVRLEIPRQFGDPWNTVEVASTLRAKAEGDGEAYDEVWCVFDRDDHERYADAVSRANALGLSLAVSNECFELWLLLHFEDSPGSQDRAALRRRVKQHLPGYDKRIDHRTFEQLRPNIRIAYQRAKRLCADAERHDVWDRNPTTHIHALLRSIAGEDLD